MLYGRSYDAMHDAIEYNRVQNHTTRYDWILRTRIMVIHNMYSVLDAMQTRNSRVAV